MSLRHAHDEPATIMLERTVGSHSLAAAAQHERSTATDPMTAMTKLTAESIIPMWARTALVVVVLTAQASGQSPLTVPYPRDDKTNLMKYAVVDHSDGMSRDLYASRDAIEALERDPRLKEFPVRVLFALDVYSARLLGRDDPGAPWPVVLVRAAGLKLATRKNE